LSGPVKGKPWKRDPSPNISVARGRIHRMNKQNARRGRAGKDRGKMHTRVYLPPIHGVRLRGEVRTGERSHLKEVGAFVFSGGCG